MPDIKPVNGVALKEVSVRVEIDEVLKNCETEEEVHFVTAHCNRIFARDRRSDR